MATEDLSTDQQILLMEKKLEDLLEKKNTLTGAKNKKKRSAMNKKIKNVEACLSLLRGEDEEEDEESGEYEPVLEPGWLTKTYKNFAQYEQILIPLGARELCNITGQRLRTEFNITNGQHRKLIKQFLTGTLKNTLQWQKPMEQPFIKETISPGPDPMCVPKVGDKLSVYYRGTLRADPETQFDSNIGRPSPFQFEIGKGFVIRGWDEGLLEMHLGEKATLTIRSDYAYGREANGAIPSHADLVFEVELVGINDTMVQ